MILSLVFVIAGVSVGLLVTVKALREQSEQVSRIIAGQSGTFVAMPSRKTQTGEYKDIAHPINSAFRSDIQRQILDAYESMDATEGDGDSPSDEGSGPHNP